jgi:hypothetical protein
MKCANCESDALYVYEVTDTYGIPYCQYHLPVFLTKLQKSGQLKPADGFDQIKAEALAAVAPKGSKKKDADIPAVEEAPAEEVAPAKDGE